MSRTFFPPQKKINVKKLLEVEIDTFDEQPQLSRLKVSLPTKINKKTVAKSRANRKMIMVNSKSEGRLSSDESMKEGNQ